MPARLPPGYYDCGQEDPQARSRRVRFSPDRPSATCARWGKNVFFSPVRSHQDTDINSQAWMPCEFLPGPVKRLLHFTNRARSDTLRTEVPYRGSVQTLRTKMTCGNDTQGVRAGITYTCYAQRYLRTGAAYRNYVLKLPTEVTYRRAGRRSQCPECACRSCRSARKPGWPAGDGNGPVRGRIF
jgi:hypothetical protein